jgi:lysophospholipase L1-like esterase
MGCLTDLNGDGQLVGFCIGNSNTWPGWPAPDGEPRWCQMLPAEAYDTASQNILPLVIRSGAATSDYTLAACHVSPPFPGGADQLTAAIAANSDLGFVMVGLGTNDLRFGGTPEETVACLKDMEAIALAAGIRFFVSTEPAIYDGSEGAALVPTLNALIYEAFSTSNTVIDFYNGFNYPEHYSGPYHLNEAGQQLRAKRARRTW